MKNYLSIIVLLAIPLIASSQETTLLAQHSSLMYVPEAPMFPGENDAYPISGFALSINPLGFLQFGPSISAEIGLTGSLVLNAHVRFPSLGLLSYVVHLYFS